ncbi:MAG: HigA family addiction module antitoxin [Planctomycetota bacterium]|jgi:addiction module HigA family antidote
MAQLAAKVRAEKEELLDTLKPFAEAASVDGPEASVDRLLYPNCREAGEALDRAKQVYEKHRPKTEKRTVPGAFHPSEYIREEIKERGWTSSDLAAALGYEPNIVTDLLAGRHSVSTDVAQKLGEAFGTGAQVWLNLQAAYELANKHRLKPDNNNPETQERTD